MRLQAEMERERDTRRDRLREQRDERRCEREAERERRRDEERRWHDDEDRRRSEREMQGMMVQVLKEVAGGRSGGKEDALLAAVLAKVGQPDPLVLKLLDTHGKTEACRPQPNGFRNQTEFVIYGTKGGIPAIDPPVYLPGVIRCPAPRERVHMTEKSVDLLRQLVRLCPAGSLRPICRLGHDRACGPVARAKLPRLRMVRRVPPRRLPQADGGGR